MLQSSSFSFPVHFHFTYLQPFALNSFRFLYLEIGDEKKVESFLGKGYLLTDIFSKNAYQNFSPKLNCIKFYFAI